ncbi:hypothetical protein [Chroococcidiopsis sp.]|uniref:hypothetical protein n=1 Tax=Chroococcidiopsis sp. TaxID=3088168 RepID=UPI003F3737CF
MKAQELIDKVLNFYKTPGNNPGFQDDNCLYWINDSSMCAIGCLLDEPERFQKAVETEFNCSGISSLYYQMPQGDHPLKWMKLEIERLFPDDFPDAVAFLRDLQGVHDKTARSMEKESQESFHERLLPALNALKTKYNLE